MDYTNYVKWKDWKWASPEDLRDWQRQSFRKELAKVPGTPKQVLEIGFGAGEFMVFAREQGMEIHGVELIPELVEEARRNEFPAEMIDFANEETENGWRRFDLVVMFDVIEHIPRGNSQIFWKNIGRALKEGGFVLCRFPNGNSPFSLPYYNGDLTHQVWLNATSLEQQLLGTDLALVAFDNAARVASGKLRLLKRMLFVVRSVTEWLVGLTYHGCRFPMDPNAVALLKKETQSSNSHGEL